MKPQKRIEELNLLISRLAAQLPTEDWIHCDDPRTQIVCDGIVKKFEIPEAARTSLLKVECEFDWMEYDKSLESKPDDIVFGYINPSRVREALAQNLNGFVVRFEDGWVGPGETYLPSNGWVDPATKFDGKWAVTPECYPLFREWVTSFRLLRRFIANQTFESKRPGRLVVINGVNFQMPDSEVDLVDAARRACEEEGCEYHFHKGLFLCKLRNQIEIVPGNRFSTVPKNNKKRRPICVEPLGNMVIQKAIGAALRRCLKANSGIDLLTAQDRHADLIKSGRYATIDLSNASDSVSLGLVRRLLPGYLTSLLEKSRSPETLTSEGWYRTNKVSSMGNGFTFELMTFILHTTLCTELGTDDVFVYGDDIIVPKELYNAACWVLLDLGFSINFDKSCWDGYLAESCGAFTVGGEYVTRYDFRYMEDVMDMIIFSNKLGRLIRANQVSKGVLSTLTSMKLLIDAEIPSDCHGPLLNRGDEIPTWLEKEQYQMESTPFRKHVASCYQVPIASVAVVTAYRRVLSKERRGRGITDLLVNLRAGRSVSRFKKQTVLQACTWIIVGGEPLMPRSRWNKLQKGWVRAPSGGYGSLFTQVLGTERAWSSAAV